MPQFNTDQMHVNAIQVFYDKSTHTTVKETPTLLQYESQHFRCKVHLQFQECMANENWSVGLIQACDYMYLENRYGNAGSSFWEFHPLKTERQKMVNDSDGRQYPFYSLTSSKCEVRPGLVQDTTLCLQFEDHFYPTVAWELPFTPQAKLSDVIRRQNFWIWLVAIKRAATHEDTYDLFNAAEDKIYVMKTMRWRYNLHLSLDHTKPIGCRVTNIVDAQEEHPYILEEGKNIPLSALSPPHCNAAQSLIWYPKKSDEEARILVPPRQSIVPWNSWVSEMMPNSTCRLNKPKDCVEIHSNDVDSEIGEINSHKSCSKKIPQVKNVAAEKTRITPSPRRV